MSPNSEQKILQEYRKGSNEAIATVITEESINLLALASSLLPDVNAAKDVIQNVAEELIKRPIEKRIDNPPKNVSLKTQIYSLVRSRAIDYYRKQEQLRKLHTRWSEDNIETEIWLFSELEHKTKKLPTHILDVQEHQLYQFRFINEYSVAKTCAQLEITKEEYRKKLQGIKRKLKREVLKNRIKYNG